MVQPAELSAGKVPCVATFIVKNEFLTQFEDLAKTLVPSVRQEPGCLYYTMTKSVEQNDPDHTKVCVFRQRYMTRTIPCRWCLSSYTRMKQRFRPTWRALTSVRLLVGAARG